MASDKFPAYPCLEDESNFKGLFRKNSRLPYVASLHKDLVKSIVTVKCSDINCDKSLIDEGSSPMTGYCGHLFCSGCANALVVQYNENWERNNGTTKKGTPHDIRAEEKEVHFDISFISRPLYHCKHCTASVANVRQSDRDMPYLKLFSANRMVENLYKALKKNGFPCCHPECREWHPMFNSLYCTKCTVESNAGSNEVHFRHVCMSHANDHLEHTLVIMDPEPRYPYFKAKMPPSGKRLFSVDRTDLRVIASFYHCAHCRKLLDDVKKDKNKDLSLHLECGHFVGSDCVKKILEIAKNHFLICFFCNEKFGITFGKTHFMFPGTQLADFIQKTPHKLVKCKIGKCGRTLHPREMAVAKACEWCDAAKKLMEKKKEKEQQEILDNSELMEALAIPSRSP